MEALGKIPEVGDSFEQFGLSVEVVEMDGRRVESVHITDKRAAETEEEENSDESSEGDPEHSAHE